MRPDPTVALLLETTIAADHHDGRSEYTQTKMKYTRHYTHHYNDENEVQDVSCSQHEGTSNDAQAWLKGGLDKEAELRGGIQATQTIGVGMMMRTFFSSSSF